METTNTSTTTQDQHDELNGVTNTPASECSYKSAEEAAIAYAKAGLSVIPLREDKKPTIDKWKDLKSRIASEDEIRQWYRDPNAKGVGILCGAISGNVECCDDDEKHNIDPVSLLDQFAPAVEMGAPGLLGRLVHETSVNAGHHFVYRCQVIAASTKLARREPTEGELKTEPKLKSKDLIETRGEGAYFACYPTRGYQLLAGSFTNIPEISVAEREILLAAARALNRYTKEEPVFTGMPKKRTVSVVRPGDDYNLRGDVRPVLKEAGWNYGYAQGDVEYWRRPGKRDGISASFNKHPGMFYVFSSNGDPLQQETWYTKFGLLALLKYNGDAVAAAKDLAEQGYGETVVAAAESYMNEHFDVRFNVVTGRVEFKRKIDADFKVLQDYDLNSIYRKLRYSHIEMSVNNLAKILASEYAERFDPFRAYYESLPAWDKSTDYIAELAQTVALKDPAKSEIFTTYLRKWLVAAVGCAIDPETVNHSCLVLVGPQGRYKTTWLNRLVPDRLSQYIHVGTINPADKDTEIHLSECFLVNLDELETLTKHDLGTLKSIMTYKSSRLRRPYGYFAETLTRRASFVGSINRDSFLTDETGTRRFLVAEVETINTGHGIDMDKVHAQAYHLFKEGFRHWFDRDETLAVNERNTEFSVQTTEDELVSQYCVATSARAEWITATQVANQIAERTTYRLVKSSARDFGFALKKAGYQSRKLNGITRYAVDVASSLRFQPTAGGVRGGVEGGASDAGTTDTPLFSLEVE